jgi:Acetyltransferase (GNAT) family
MSTPRFTWRAMRADDLQAATLLSEVLHPSKPEDDGIFAEKFNLFPEGCLSLVEKDCFRGYFIAHPWEKIQELQPFCLIQSLPKNPDSLFIHDVGLHPNAQRKDLASVAVAMSKIIARKHGFERLLGIANNNTYNFWEKLGAKRIEAPLFTKRLLATSPIFEIRV